MITCMINSMAYSETSLCGGEERDFCICILHMSGSNHGHLCSWPDKEGETSVFGFF